MTKAEAIRIIVECAEAYRDNLENTNLLIAYKDGHILRSFRALFLPRHFMHLTGVKNAPGRKLTSVAFYQKCLDHRLSASDFAFAEDGTTPLKLAVLPQLMKRNLSAKMIGDFRERTFVLSTEKVAGSITACIGFVYDEQSGYYVPNTVLKRDIRDVTKGNYSRILMTWQKNTKDTQFQDYVYCAKGFDQSEIDKDSLGQPS